MQETERKLSLPQPSRLRQVGVSGQEYRLSDTASTRRRAIQMHMYKVHARHIGKLLEQKPTRDTDMIAKVGRRAQLVAAVRPTAVSLKQRLNLIRIFQKNHQDPCRKLTADMKWMDQMWIHDNHVTTSDICRCVTNSNAKT